MLPTFVFHPTTFVSDIFSNVHLILDNYAENTYSVLRETLRTPLAMLITLYYMVMGISVMYGWIDMSIKNIAKSAIKVGLIYSFAMNWDFFTIYFMNLIFSTMDTVSNVVMQLGFESGTNNISIGDSVQTVLDHVWNLTEKFWKEASIYKPLPLLYGLIDLALGSLVLAIACSFLLIAQVMLALLFGTAPLFIAFVLFKPTQSFFNNWLGEITAQAMSVIFVSAALGMVISMLTWVFPQVSDSEKIDPALILAMIFVCLISFVILKQSATVGRKLGGGISDYCQYSIYSGASATSQKYMNKTLIALGFKKMPIPSQTYSDANLNYVMKWWRNRQN